MDFSFTAEQNMLRNSFKEFFSKECSADLVREFWNSPKGYSEAVWKKMAKLGWLGLIYNETCGGSECGIIDLFILFEELGKSLLPSPLFTSTVLCGMLIDQFGNPQTRQKDLGAIVSGKKIATLALLDGAGEPDFDQPRLEAVADGPDAYVLNGVRLLVPYADVADEIIVCANVTGVGAGPTLLRVDAKSAELTCEPLNTVYGERKCAVRFSNVRVGADKILGASGQGNLCIMAILPIATVLKCAEMVGGAGYLVESTVNYAKDRKQFGRPIGSFQAVQHFCADMQTLYIASRLVAYHAASLLNKNIACDKEVAIAKAWCSDAYKQISWIAQQIHGGIGFTEEYPIHLYFKHAKECELLFGDSHKQRSVVADSMSL